MFYPETHYYIEKLNAEEFAGFNDWRLPTLEETMSLMEQRGANGLQIDGTQTAPTTDALPTQMPTNADAISQDTFRLFFKKSA